MTDDDASLPAGPALIRASTIVTARYDALAAAHGLTPQQARLLFVLHRQPSNMLGLGATERVSKSTMTGVIARMHKIGLVERTPDPADRRNLVVMPTAHGIEVLEAFEQELRAATVEMLVPLDPAERVQLAGLLSALVRADEHRA
jgi:DNA-binding MarR family transcriptional regulator